MKEKWLKYKKWRQDRFLKNWPRTRERGKLFFVMKTAFFWALWMTFWFMVYDKYFSGRVTNIILSAIIHSILGIILGIVNWAESERHYQKLIASAEAQE